MVVTGIFLILTSVVLSANARFGNLVVLQSLAHEMALTVREAQVYGIAVRRYQGVNFDVSYGMHFALTAPTAYELWGDASTNGIYEPGETVKPSTINGGYFISDICVRTKAQPLLEDCTPTVVDIVFRRPEPDACMSVGGGATFVAPSYACVGSLERAKIILASPSGNMSSITVESSGQISVQ